jgi:hypothetical protein
MTCQVKQGDLDAVFSLDEGPMKKDWLQRITTVENAERDHLVTDERLGPHPVPFGFQHDSWLQFKSLIRESDELWEFSSPPPTWERLAGRRGLCLLRNGRIVASLITLMN